MSKDILKSCPFCGSKKVKIIEDNTIDRTIYFVRCDAPVSVQCFGAIINMFIDRAKAISAWNRRKV